MDPEGERHRQIACILCGSLFNLKISPHNGFLYCPACYAWHMEYDPGEEWFLLRMRIRYRPAKFK